MVRVRLQDVAARAGVSVKTVSNVVNGYRHVAPDTRARVQLVLDEMGYRPNLAARNLRAGRTGVIALALPDLDNPYFAELTGSVVRAAEKHGLTVLVDQTEGLRDRELEVVEGFRNHLIDGLVMSPMALRAKDLTGRAAVDIPVVLLGEKFGAGAVDHVAIDNVAAAEAATAHLVALGRTRIAVVGDQPGSRRRSGVAHLRRQGWERALTAAGLDVDERLVAPVPAFDRQHGAAAVAALLDDGARPDALFCFNDTLAIGALRLLADRGIDVPGDVAVIGIDDVAEGRFAVPTLSTVAPDKAGIARTAVAMLAERLDPASEQRPPRDVRAGFELVARESTLGRSASAVSAVRAAAAVPPPRGTAR
ncbi:LacI family DNA-binding transcriptional regulator [Nocardioides sp. TF02-7]|uniref:LacI family DNA-binding transcriptional regulator n=1 Tax=Nocardioides sp. TF02-7 TaxID=2917724 RepID=UPI001F05ECA8|nr:LacI family DNA-binding transcriptional regulator [Nocardioides sp. TF02-7]UMG92853.1 LacI family transcriptional regulator [Nocardioides sp. TF02-7]